jgi:hypothetical protein
MATAQDAQFDIRRFVLALVVDLASDKNFKPSFRAAHKKLHGFFWQLKKDEHVRPFVSELLFDTNGNYPMSETLDELLHEFQLSGVLCRPNPAYKFNDVSVNKSALADEFKRALTSDLKRSYEEVSKRFREDLGVRES